MSIEDMVNFCLRNVTVPDDIDEAFVLAYEHSERSNLDGSSDEDDDYDSDTDSEVEIAPTKWFRYIISTRRLLQNSANSNVVQADATHKIIVQRYPVLVFGTTDMDHKFHLLGVMVSKTETSADFEFGFRAIREAIWLIERIDFNPQYLMADGAHAIGNGFKRVFGQDKTIRMCLSHMKRAVDNQKLRDKNNMKPIKADIDKLKLSFCRETFEQGIKLFSAKWKKKEPGFIAYFIKYWVQTNSNWYDGAGIRTPSTNNGLEGWNGVLKKYHTKRFVKGLAEVKVRLMSVVKLESQEYLDKPAYQHVANLSNNVLKDGLAYSKVKHVVHHLDVNGIVVAHMLHGEAGESFDQADVDKNRNTSYKTFDEWSNQTARFYTITFENDENNWKQSKCTCPAFSRFFICKHITCIAYISGKLKETRNKFLAANKPRALWNSIENRKYLIKFFVEINNKKE